MDILKGIKNQLYTTNQTVVLPMILRTLEPGGFFRANISFLEKVGYNETELSDKPFHYWLDPDDHDALNSLIESEQSICHVTHKTKDGEHLILEARIVEDQGETFILARSPEKAESIDISKDSEDEATISGTLHTIANIIEEQNPGYKCSILLVADGCFVRGAGPSLPEEYNAAIDGYAIGPTVGSCGTAIYWNIPVIVDDIQKDPLWKPFAKLAQKAGVAACWSYPFSSTTGNVLGALALYSPVPKSPTKEQLGRLKAAAKITGLAVERGRAEEALRKKHKRELELEEQLHQARKMESIGNLAGGIAHEFNNILSIIIGNNELIQEELPEWSIARENTEEIRIAVMRAHEVIRQLLTFSRQDDSALQVLDLGLVVLESLKLIRSSTTTNIEIKHDISDDVSSVLGNATQINQLLINLCSNAVDAMLDHRGMITVALSNKNINSKNIQEQNSILPGNYVKLQISDTGMGMNKEILDKAFEPYFTTKDIGKGTGIGLAVVHGIVEKHGGYVVAESIPGKGTTFAIYLPVHEGLPEGEPEEDTSLPKGNECVLYVDDEPSIAKLGKRHLENLGYTAVSTTDPLKALEMIKSDKDRFDLLISDMAMPKITGDILITEVLKICPDMPTILCTGYSATLSRKKASNIGASSFVMKPLNKYELAQTVRTILDEYNTTGKY